MEKVKVRAKLKNLDITPRKARRVGALLAGLEVNNALAELSMNKTRGAYPLTKLLQSAIAGAKEKKLNPDKLVVRRVQVDQGRALKRLLPQGRGRASLIKKRFSHVTIELTESEQVRGKGFVMPKKVKKVRATPTSTRPAPKVTESPGRPKEKKGFMQKVFSRKAV
ncbi:MAG: 50S ribosomal protein L22 [Candidatus Colwellbacteria bacterium]|nr:50S ribosomal protein L22 [Candidatus Colwellbacteria bacterium]